MVHPLTNFVRRNSAEFRDCRLCEANVTSRSCSAGASPAQKTNSAAETPARGKRRRYRLTHSVGSPTWTAQRFKLQNTLKVVR